MKETVIYRTLSSPSRTQILRLLYQKPLGVEEIAEKLKLQPITVRHHLQFLIEAGLVEAYEDRSGSIGRPKTYYKIVKNIPQISFPRRQYLALTNFLIDSLRFTFGEAKAKKFLRKVGLKMGEKTAKQLRSKYLIAEWSPKAFQKFFVEGYLEEMGAEPEIVEVADKKVVYRLHNCIFFEMSLKMPDIMCDVLHASFYDGLIKATGNKIRIERLTCMAKDDAYCEHVCEWIS
ncbi:ArsR family transcriptional regulator [Candidatus Bathyarchaeota archaeon]|nr:ArsR family transcriptional regulator [Candidatus Bathyarchaeota archaeon]